MTSTAYDWSRFTKRIPIRAGIQTIYDAWTTRHQLESWFLRKAEFTTPEGNVRNDTEAVQAGDVYEWMWFGYPDSVAEHGEVLEANGRDRFRFVFGSAGVVTVSVSDRQGLSIVELTQENISTEEEHKVRWHLGCTEGWTFYLANLKSFLEGGMDLRNKDEAIQGVLNS